MPTRPAVIVPQLTSSEREARKRFLILACACDRVELALAWRQPSRTMSIMSGIAAATPWLQTASSFLLPLLPRKFRFATSLYRLWKARH